MRQYLNDNKVPQLFVSTGATTFDRDYAQYPWTLGWQPDYEAEGAIYGKYIAKNLPTAKLGVLYQNDDYGNDYLRGLKAGLTQQHQTQIVDAEPLRPQRDDAAGGADGEAQGLGRRHVRHLRDADADHPGVRHLDEARLAPGARDHELRLRDRRVPDDRDEVGLGQHERDADRRTTCSTRRTRSTTSSRA